MKVTVWDNRYKDLTTYTNTVHLCVSSIR